MLYERVYFMLIILKQARQAAVDPNASAKNSLVLWGAVIGCPLGVVVVVVVAVSRDENMEQQLATNRRSIAETALQTVKMAIP
jgi:hypothetical protein